MPADSSTTYDTTPVVELPAIARGGAFRKLMRRSAYWLTLGGLFLLSAEMTARLEDWARLGVPLFSTPDQDRDLFLTDSRGTRGRPHGRFKKWQLNQFGFRGPEIALDPSPGCTRIIILGASEPFGLYESEGKEFPAQLGERLDHDGRYEVINAAVPGITIRSMLPYWDSWVKQFRPDIVILYPSPPLFYLNDFYSGKPPAKQPRPDPDRGLDRTLPSRLLFRMKDVFHLPEFIQDWRKKRQIDALIAGQDDDWFMKAVPPDRLDLLTTDVAKLMKAIEKQGAQPVLMTHAVRTTLPPRREDFKDLRNMRVYLPRVKEEVLATFEYAAAQALASEGAKNHIRVINVAEAMNGCRDCFADLVHFTDEGAARVAALVAEGIQTNDKRTSPDQAKHTPQDKPIRSSNGG